MRVVSELASNPQALEDYARELARQKGLVFECIRKRKVFKYQQIIIGDSRLYVTGKKEVRNACQFAFARDETALIERLGRGGACSDREMLDVLHVLQEKYARFAPRLAQQMRVLELEDSFVKADPADRCAVLVSLVTIAAAHTNMIDLSSVGGSKYAGCMNVSFSKELSSDGIVFVDSSVTGMFERRYRIGL